MVSSKFYVFLPIINNGTEAARNVKVPAIDLSGVQLTTNALPLSLADITSNGRNALDFTFDSSSLSMANEYLLTVRGTYQTGATTIGLVVNRILTIVPATSFLQQELHDWAAIDAVAAEYNSLPRRYP